jgi:hypothetical protein
LLIDYKTIEIELISPSNPTRKISPRRRSV